MKNFNLYFNYCFSNQIYLSKLKVLTLLQSVLFIDNQQLNIDKQALVMMILFILKRHFIQRF